jgi:hypothetical protein
MYGKSGETSDFGHAKVAVIYEAFRLTPDQQNSKRH